MTKNQGKILRETKNKKNNLFENNMAKILTFYSIKFKHNISLQHLNFQTSATPFL